MPHALQVAPRPPLPRRRGWSALAPAGRPAAPLRVARPMGPLDPEQHEEKEQQAAIRERLEVRALLHAGAACMWCAARNGTLQQPPAWRHTHLLLS